MPHEPSALAACPFCGNALFVTDLGTNPYARCDTEACWMHQRAISIPLDDPKHVSAWNTRAQPDAAMVEARAKLLEKLGEGEFYAQGDRFELVWQPGNPPTSFANAHQVVAKMACGDTAYWLPGLIAQLLNAALRPSPATPSEQRLTMTLTLTEREQDAIERLMAEQELSRPQIFRCALRSYQADHERRLAGETVAWSGDEQRARDFAGPLVSPATPSKEPGA